MTGVASLAAGGFGALAALANGVLVLLVAAGRLRLQPALALAVLMAAAAGTVAGVLLTLETVDPAWYARLGASLRILDGIGELAAARSIEIAVLVETLGWTLFLALAGRVFGDGARTVALLLALGLGLAVALVAPSEPLLLATAAVALIGLFLAIGLAGGGPASPFDARPALLFLLAFGFAYDVVLAALALAPLGPHEPLAIVRPLFRAVLIALAALHIGAVAHAGARASLRPRARRNALVVAVTGLTVLLVAALATWLGRATGPVLGLALFLPAVLVLLAAALMPGGGARLDAFFARHWRPYRYNYREIWPGFVDVLTGADPRPSDDLPERVIRAVAGTVGAKGGAVWLADGDDQFRLIAAHGIDPAKCASGWVPGLGAALEAAEMPHLAATALPHQAPWPDLLPPRHLVWLVLTLVHKERLFGFLVLVGPKERRPLDVEDRELLRLVAGQAASYLAEEETARQLANARQFENFTRRFAYVMHDVKNVASELSLTLANARRHRGNPAFYDDMLETLGSSVARMNRLIEQLRQEAPPRLERVDLAPLVRRLAARRSDRRLLLDLPLAEVAARVEAAALETALEHLVDNALEAVGAAGRVSLSLQRCHGMAAVTVADDGPGLPPQLLAETGRRRAFASSKPGGFGLGLDQARHTVERVGGRFDLRSSPSAGTTVALYLPELETPPRTEEQRREPALGDDRR